MSGLYNAVFGTASNAATLVSWLNLVAQHTQVIGIC